MTCSTCPHNPARQTKAAHGAGWTLYQADFRAVAGLLADGSVDALITDPPYGSGGFTVKDRLRSSKSKSVSSGAAYQHSLPDIDGDSLHPKAWEQLMLDVCVLVKQKLKVGGVFALFIDWRNKGELQAIIQASGLTLRGHVVWDKKNSRPIRNGFQNQAEYIFWGTHGPMPKRNPAIYLPGVFRHITMTNRKVHITQKPLALMLELVKVCPPGGVIYDPFADSGTTGVAALQSGYQFVGCESVPVYFDVAKQRLEDESRQTA